jgi:DNA sulfur modification protein DndD
MILETLKVNNFRVFKGAHEFDLKPRKQEGFTPPIVLFGGLNGAGKTSTLTAIRLALYGRQSLGAGTTQKAYLQYLSDAIHESKVNGIKETEASVELTFSYANLGILKHYLIKRAWTNTDKGIKETIAITQDGEIVENLSYDQAQGFLNELIPIGVSDLFFFDGEKIAQLAEDDDGEVLADSVKKLIGIDLIEKLMGDLTVYIRNTNRQQQTKDIQAQITKLEASLDEKERAIELEKDQYQAVKIDRVSAEHHIEQLTNALNSHGGTWAATREQELEKLNALNSEKDEVEHLIKEALAGSFPFSIASDYVEHCLGQLEQEKSIKHGQFISYTLSSHIDSLEKRLLSLADSSTHAAIKREIQEEFSEVITQKVEGEIIHDVSDTLHNKLTSIATESLTTQRQHTKQLASRLEQLNQKIDAAGVNIARAPEEGVLAVRLNELNEAQNKKAAIIAREAEHKNNIKTLLQEAMDIVRALEKLYSIHMNADENNQALDYALKAKEALNEFALRTSVSKIKNVEKEFIESFKRLARKEDISISAVIEPQTFSVKLLNEFGSEIPKDNLSAGERQIYAIAMLEALARTSGRKLPIIIDTPLARLDSEHRKKLVKNYFPNASHQVIILSTDTEIGEEYYQYLSKHISHNILLDFKGQDGSTAVKSGYFWSEEEAKLNAT